MQRLLQYACWKARNALAGQDYPMHYNNNVLPLEIAIYVILLNAAVSQWKRMQRTKEKSTGTMMIESMEKHSRLCWQPLSISWLDKIQNRFLSLLAIESFRSILLCFCLCVVYVLILLYDEESLENKSRRPYACCCYWWCSHSQHIIGNVYLRLMSSKHLLWRKHIKYS